MRKLILIALSLACGAAAAGPAAMPPGTTWYFHADLEEMRRSEAGRALYAWLDSEVFTDIRSESGFDPHTEADRITAFSADGTGTVIVLEGDITQTSKDRLLAIAAGAERLETLKSGGKTFYYIQDERHRESRQNGFDDFEDGAYFSFSVEDRLIATSSRGQMEALLANGGRLPGQGNRGALFVISAEKSFVSAGLRADELRTNGGWDSNILRNTEQVGVTVADVAGRVGIEAELIAKETEMADSLASIVRGVISLQAFNRDLDPALVAILRGTTVDVAGRTLSIRLAVDPSTIVAMLGS